jgi:hypothetical protein
MKTNKCWLVLIIRLCSCIETFDPEIDKVEEGALVIEGLITNESRPYEVKISKSISIEESGTSYELISDANVIVMDKNGITYSFEMTSPGIYKSNENEFIGEIGNGYQLIVEYNNSTYESSYEDILPNYAIDSVYGEFEYRAVQSETGEITNQPFINIYADINFPNQEYYYRYDWEATYKAETPLQGSNICWPAPNNIPLSDLDPLKNCYVNEMSNGFLRIFTSKGLTGTKFTKYLIYSVNPNKRLQIKYSPLIKQYTLSPEAFAFWNSIENQSLSGGGLFDAPPTQIIGNIRNTSNDDEVVLGYFTASSVAKTRVFLLPSLVPELDHYAADCSTASGSPLSPPIVPPPSCCECTFLPFSSEQKPDFWID